MKQLFNTIGIIAVVVGISFAGLFELITGVQIFGLVVIVVVVVGIIAGFLAINESSFAYVFILALVFIALTLVVTSMNGYYSAWIADAEAQKAQQDAMQAAENLKRAAIDKENLRQMRVIFSIVAGVLEPDPPPEFEETYELERKFRLGVSWATMVAWGLYGLGVFVYAYTLLLLSAVKKRGYTNFTINADFVLFIAGGIAFGIALWPTMSQNDAATTAAVNRLFWLSAIGPAVCAYILARLKKISKNGEEALKEWPLPLTLFKTMMFPLAGSIIAVLGIGFVLNVVGNELVWTTQLTARSIQLIQIHGGLTGLLLPKFFEQIEKWLNKAVWSKSIPAPVEVDHGDEADREA